MSRVKAQLYDKIQSVIGNYNDRMVRGIFEYDSHIDEKALEAVLLCFCKASPVMHSAFRRGVFSHCWVEKEFSTEDILQVEHTETPLESARKFITGVLPVDGNIQFRIALFKSEDKSFLSVLTNHMYMDGGDLKRLMKNICSAYEACVKGEDFTSFSIAGDRSFKTVYKDLPKSRRRHAKLLYSNPTLKHSKSIGLSKKSEEDLPFIITKNIPIENFDRIKSYGKSRNATINDMVLTAFYMSLYECGYFPEYEDITISCAMDLRRYMNAPESTGITNHSSYITYTLNGADKSFELVLKKVNEISQSYKSHPLTGLYGLPLLNMGFSCFPNIISDILVKKFYNNPSIAMSNIGLLKDEDYVLNGKAPVSAFLTGSVKFKPSIMVSLTTYKKTITLSMCAQGTSRDKLMLETLLESIAQKLSDLTEA